MAVFAPMHNASVATAVTVKTGFLRRTRTAYLRSRMSRGQTNSRNEMLSVTLGWSAKASAERLPQLVALELARRRLRQLGQKRHPARPLVIRQAIADELLQRTRQLVRRAHFWP